MSYVILLIGIQGSSKSSLARELEKEGYFHLSRDKEGGSYESLSFKLEKLLSEGQNVVIDNTNILRSQRKLFVDVAKKHNANIKGIWCKTSLVDCEINIAMRLMQKKCIISNMSNLVFNTLFDPKNLKNKKDPNIFYPGVFLSFHKKFEEPNILEGFDELEIKEFKRDWDLFTKQTNKALILDYDGTLRDVPENEKDLLYPRKKEHINILPNRKEILKKYQDDGYILCGISNQSGIEKGILTTHHVDDLFDYTNHLLGCNIDVRYCGHTSKRNQCYCRKPGVLNALYLIRKYNLSIKDSIFVGDFDTDRQMAEKIGFQYYDAKDFFEKESSRT